MPRFAFIGPGCLISAATVATPFHEAGHAVVGLKLSGNMPLKMSVIPQAESMGRTRNCPWPRSFSPEKRMTALTRGGLANCIILCHRQALSRIDTLSRQSLAGASLTGKRHQSDFRSGNFSFRRRCLISVAMAANKDSKTLSWAFIASSRSL